MRIEDFPYGGDVTIIRAMRKPTAIYLRFGHFGDDQSMNWSSGEYERGTSVYEAEMVDGAVRIHPDWYKEVKWGWDRLNDRTVYAVTGRELCKGSDGEPVLATGSIVVRGVLHPAVTEGLRIDLGDLRLEWQ